MTQNSPSAILITTQGVFQTVRVLLHLWPPISDMQVRTTAQIMEPEGSSPRSRQPATCHYHEPPDQSSPQPLILFLQDLLRYHPIYVLIFHVISFPQVLSETLYEFVPPLEHVSRAPPIPWSLIVYYITFNKEEFQFFVAQRPNAGRGFLIFEASRSHTTTQYSR